MRAGIARVDAGALVERALGAELPDTWILAAGKAAVAMARAAVGRLGAQVRGGIVIAPAPLVDPVPGLVGVAANHPVPGAESQRAGEQALALARGLSSADHLLVLISGGASALMAVPAPGITLGEKQDTTRHLLQQGADIYALNTVRKHLSAIKGGQLAAATAARCTTLVVSDVVGDDLSVIASGPTVPDLSTFADALEILSRHGGVPLYPLAVVQRLTDGASGRHDETPKPADATTRPSDARIIGGRFDAMRGAADAARALGYHTVVLEPPVVGLAAARSRIYLEEVIARSASWPRPSCVISSGETTVRVTGGGRGGRNQEFSLALVEAIARSEPPMLFASVGTDGIDGPTDAAGAIVDPGTLDRARAAGLAPVGDYLASNDSYHFFEGTADLVKTGPTGTNVGDLQVMLIT